MPCTSLYSQTTIWSVNFETGYSDNDASAQDNNSPAGADWTKSGSPSNWWRVESDNAISGSLSMSGRNTDATMTWTSESIDISGYSNVSISIDLAEVNCDDGSSDQIETFYNVGSGNVEFGDGNGDGNFNSATNTIAALSGSSLTITVTLFNNGGGERCIFDNIVVTGTASLGPDGPGGVGSTDGSDALEVWLKADDLDADGDQSDNPSNGSNVSTWTDHSGNGNNYTNTGSNRPTYSTSGTYNAVNFNASAGTAQYLNGASSGSYSDGSAFFAHNTTNVSASHLTFDNGSYSLRTEQWSNSGVVGFTRYGVADYTTSISSPFGSNSIYSFHKDGSSSNMDIRVNDDTETLAIGSSAAGIPYDRLGKNSTTTDEASGDFFEVILFSQDLNEMQIILIDNYLSAKYGGIDIPTDIYDGDNVANGNFDFDVAGIGQASDGSNHLDAQGTGVVRVRNASNLGNGEFFVWGHDNTTFNADSETDLPTGIEARIERTWRVSETGEVGTVTLSFDLTDVPGSVTTSDLRLLIDTDGDGFFNDETVGTGGVISGASNTSGNIYEWTGIDIDDAEHFTIGSINITQTPLPVELTSFKALLDQENEWVELIWITQTEINNDYFTLEKTTGDGEFTWVGEIQGQGTHNGQYEYTFIDEEPWTGISYYRLTQVDEDGKETHYPLEAVNYELPTPKILTAFPNPLAAGEELTIQFSGSDYPQIRSLVLHDQSGRAIDLSHDPSLQVEPGEVSFVLPHTLPTGIYVATMVTDNESPHYLPVVVR
ncbi:hypothetical protein KFE98_03165 [bacterium SCSIO 12741]|nr:hypothetical protein KFE98_03165 [bacterium SCSIO 12741]